MIDMESNKLGMTQEVTRLNDIMEKNIKGKEMHKRKYKQGVIIDMQSEVTKLNEIMEKNKKGKEMHK